MKRVLALVLTLVMCISLLPTMAYAESEVAPLSSEGSNEPEARIFEYKTSFAALNTDNMKVSSEFQRKPHLRYLGVNYFFYYMPYLNYTTQVPAEETKDGTTPFYVISKVSTDADGVGTDEWAFVGAVENGKGVTNISTANDLKREMKYASFDTGADSPYLALSLNVEAPGEYLLQLDTKSRVLTSAVPAVYFFKDDGKDYATSSANLPANAKVGYFNATDITKSGYEYIGTVNVESAGNYIIAFVADAASKTYNTNVNGDFQELYLSGIKLVPSSLEEYVGELKLTGAKQTLPLGEKLPLSVEEKWKLKGFQPVDDLSKIEFTSSDDSVAEVSADGVVTAISASNTPVTITATVKDSDPEVSATFSLKVFDPDFKQTFEYKTTFDAMNTDNMKSSSDFLNKPHLREISGAYMFYGIGYMNQTVQVPAEETKDGVTPFTVFSKISTDADGVGTDDWEYVGAVENGLARTNISSANGMKREMKYNAFGTDKDAPYLALRLNVEAKGEYLLELETFNSKKGAAPAVYFFRDDGKNYSANSSNLLESNKVGYINTSDMTATGYQFLKVVNIEKPGDYIIAFRPDAKSKEYNSTGAGDFQDFVLRGIRLTPYTTDVQLGKIQLSAEKQLIKVGEPLTLNVEELWKYKGFAAVEDLSTVEFTSSNDAVATVSENGVVKGVSESSEPVTITARLKDFGPEATATIQVMVSGTGAYKSFEFKTTFEAMNTDNMKVSSDYLSKPHLRQLNGPRYLFYDTSYMNFTKQVPAAETADGETPFYAFSKVSTDADGIGSDEWEYVGAYITSGSGRTNIIDKDGLRREMEYSYFADGSTAPYMALRLKVDAAGEYALSIDTTRVANGAAPAVYFFKDDGKNYATNSANLNNANKLGYLETHDTTKSGYEYVATVNVAEAGDYIIAFKADSTSKTLNTKVSGKIQTLQLKGIKLSAPNTDMCTSISISADTDLLYVGRGVQLKGTETWRDSGTKAIDDFSSYTFETSSASVTVDENGVVTASSDITSPVTVTAIKKGTFPPVKASFVFEVYDADQSYLGIRHNFVTASTSKLDQTVYDPHNNRLDVNGTLRDLTLVDEYDEINEDLTSPWAYNNIGSVTWKALLKEYMSIGMTPDKFAQNPFFAIKVRIPIKGYYHVETILSPLASGCEADIYLVPAGGNSKATLALATEEYFVGSVDCAGAEKQRAGTVTLAEGGDYFAIFKFRSTNETLNSEGRNMFNLKNLIISAVPGEYARVNMEIEGMREGTLAFATTNTFTYEVADAAGTPLENVAAEDVIINGFTVTQGADIATLEKIDGEYYVITGSVAGDVTITADVTYNGKNVTTDYSFKVEDIGKTGRTIYSDEIIEIARENIKNYSWAKAEKDAVVKEADKYIALGAEYIWNAIAGQGIPRSYTIAMELSHANRDAYEFNCRYCNTYIVTDYGNYGWRVDPFKSPWKIKCPECSRSFPTNDFAKFYELGRTQENGGNFDRITALENHRALLIEKGLLSEEAMAMTSPGKDLSATWYTYYGYGVKGGYLHNDMYPEVSNPDSGVKFATEAGLQNGNTADYKTIVPETVERWGVDDSLGYNTGRVFTGGVQENYSYIPYYSHFGIWYNSNSSAIVDNALDVLGKAYLYTGDEKYGELGAIILDRVADLYPDMELSVLGPPYPNANGGSAAGKAIGRIWETFIAKNFANSYDIFYPMFEDEDVIAFLSEKAEYYGYENNKKNATKIRTNIENGILRETFEGLKTAQIYGNFGLHQATCAAAAVALDSKYDTPEMLEWLYAPSTTDSKVQVYNTGGDINRKLVQYIYRDGQNWESPAYNEMGISYLIDSAEILQRYVQSGGAIEQGSIFENPKYIALVNAFADMMLVRRGVANIGDSGSLYGYGTEPDTASLIIAFKFTKDNPEAFKSNVKMAQQLYFNVGEELKDQHYDIWTKNPENLYDEVVDLVEEYGEYPYDKSSNMTGYGLAVLRDGTLYDTIGVSSIKDTTRDVELNYSGHALHQHADFLDLQIHAYGLPMTGEFGYPEFMVTGDPHSSQFSSAVLGHNTVMVNEKNQKAPERDKSTPQVPLHFDALDTRVKVADARTPDAYAECEDYRRTVIMINYDEEVSYTLDFFRVTGGNDHLWTFLPTSDARPETSDNLTFTPQVDENGEYVGTYAGPDVPFGDDADSDYPTGYTWLFEVDRGAAPVEGPFYLDYEIDDFRKLSRNPNMKLRYRMTMLNDFTADEVSLVSVLPQRTKKNQHIDHVEKVLVRHKGTNLDSLFTTVHEPYKAGEKYITNIEELTINATGGASEGADDMAKAIKVTLDDGRIDYIVYATNRDVVYTITDGDYSFEFAGFVGVWTLNENGNCIYSYIHDGTILGEGEKKITGTEAAVTGKVTDFQKELAFANWIDVEFDRDLTEEEAANLVDRMMNIDRSEPGNSSYVIKGVEYRDSRHVRIDIGDTVSTIAKFINEDNEALGYVYDVAIGKTFEIPMSLEMDGAPVFDELVEQAVSAGSSVSIKLNATPVSEDLTVTYRARTLPRGAGFDAATATFSWKPTVTQVGKNLVAIDAIDSEGRVSTLYFEIEVFGSTSGGGGGGGGGGMDIPSTDDKDDEPKEEEPNEDEPTVEPEEPTVDEPTVDGPTEKGFSDIENYAWAEESINYLADEGIIKGTSETTFAPQNNITRADYAILLVRAFKLESDNAENFADVSASDYFAKELAVARNTGIVGGIGDNKYAPKNTITRQDMMVILYRALTKMGVELKAVEGIDATSYADSKDVADYAQEAVKALIEAGLVNGKSGLIAGNDKTTRAEVAVLLKRILDYIEAK